MTDETQSSTVPDETGGPIKAEDLLDLQEKITKEILSSKLDETDMQDLQVNIYFILINICNYSITFNLSNTYFQFKAKINRELLKSKVFNLDHQQPNQGRKHRIKPTASAKARSLMNLHNNEAGRRVSFPHS